MDFIPKATDQRFELPDQYCKVIYDTETIRINDFTVIYDTETTFVNGCAIRLGWVKNIIYNSKD